jgi:hypothetical protein
MSLGSNIKPHLSKAQEGFKWAGTIDMAQKGATILSAGGIIRVDARGRIKFA